MKDSGLRTLAAVLLVAAGGCGGDALSPLPDDGVILAFGDSLTAGVGVSAARSYPSVLAELTGLRVVNAGVSGEVTAAGLRRLPGELSRATPNLLILLEGGNDILRNGSSTSTKANLAAMIEIAQASGTEVVLIGVPEKNLFSSSAPYYEQLASEYSVVFAPKIVARLLRSPAMKSDPIHFNEHGYRALAEAIHELLVDNGAL